MAGKVKIKANIAKVESFSSKSGGIAIKLEMEADWNAGAEIAKHATTPEVVDVLFDFSGGQGELGLDDEEAQEEQAPAIDG